MVNLLGVPISHISKKALLKRIEEALIHSSPLWIVTANPEILVRAYRDSTYRAILNQADVIVADGIGVVLAARLLYGAHLERITGADLAEDILRIAWRHHKKIFLLGGSAEVNRKAREKFTNMGGMGGDFDEDAVTQTINKFQPAVLLVALGAPRQEQFIDNFTNRLTLDAKPSVMMGIGGTIDFWARPSLRAPKIVQRIGLEWLWRVVRQPWRFKRIFNAVIIFPTICLYDFFQQKRRPASKSQA